jgi:methionine-rich copper-binding protein CopC
MQLRAFLGLGLPVLAAACSSPDEVREMTEVTAKSSQASAHASASASSTAEGRKVAEDTDLFSFEFSYPAAVARHPELAEQLDHDAQKQKSEMIAEAKEFQADAKTNDFPFHQHSYSAEWKVVADLPGYLSLSNDWATYTGGAHGMYGLQGFVWDKANKRGFDSAELFVSPADLDDAMGNAVCAALNKEREKRRGEPVDTKDEFFGGCPGLDEATILVGSANRKTFDRITVWFGPYVAGAYAEGAYELDFPMTKAMLDTVKPAYKAAFSVKG